jgi:thiol-disulfide isomerase/thioredoxin
MYTATLGIASAQAPAAAYESDSKFVAAMAEGKRLVKQQQYMFAEDAYKKANKIAGGKCTRCMNNVFDLQMAMGNYKDAVATASQLEAIATNPLDKSIAEGDRGRALMRGGDKPKPDQLQAAHAALQSALTIYPKNIPARFSDGCVLARLGNMEEASKQFAACADAASPSDPMKPRARHFAENPALSLSKMAPAFAVTALDGTHFNLDDMGGHIVLIDFWATWCGPCNAELPHLKKIAKEFAGQPLVIISISWDADEAKWKQFIQDHEMTWLHYRDADHKLSTEFGVNAIPHYFTIDSDGVLTAEMMGEGSDVEGKIKRLIKRANDAKAANPQVATDRHGDVVNSR